MQGIAADLPYIGVSLRASLEGLQAGIHIFLDCMQCEVSVQGPASSSPEDPGPSQMEWENPEGESSAQSAQTQQPAPEQAISTGKFPLCNTCAACYQLMLYTCVEPLQALHSTMT